MHVLYNILFSIFYVFSFNLVDLLGSVWRPSGEPKGEIKVPFSPDAPRRVPGRDLGPILLDLDSIWDVFLNLFSVIFLKPEIVFYLLIMFVVPACV